MFDLVYSSSTRNVMSMVLRNRQFGSRILGHPLSTEQNLVQALLDSKERLFFAEQGVIGGWTHLEQRILGGMGVGMKVLVFDDGTWNHPHVHPYPFEGTLLFCPGPLLARTDCWDYRFIVDEGSINQENYKTVVEERILPLLLYVQRTSRAPALVTMPGLGCGMFAGLFQGFISQLFIRTLREILEKHRHRLTKIAMVYHYAYGPGQDELRYEEEISPTMRFVQWRNGPSMLSRPSVIDSEFSDDTPLYKFVAWDHFSWPGNDFFANARNTDDGVSAAATSSMAMLLPMPRGYSYRYFSEKYKYLPFEGERIRSWIHVDPEQRLIPEQMLCLS